MNRQLTDLFKGLMFLHGHVTRSEEFGAAPLGNRAASDQWFDRHPGEGHAAAPRLGVLGQLLFLGGRPMHAGHNFDLEEPFEQLAANEDVPDCAACG